MQHTLFSVTVEMQRLMSAAQEEEMINLLAG
jgi:hypothetical protein